jgi:F-type H+-transporting ATPase subunit epsilon
VAETLTVDIVTPEGKACSENVAMVTLPGVDGRIGVLPLHVRLIAHIVPGEVVLHSASRARSIAVGAGLAAIGGTRVTVLTDMAIPAERIDEAAVDAARQRALDRLQEKLSDEELASVNASLIRSLAQLRVKRRHRT